MNGAARIALAFAGSAVLAVLVSRAYSIGIANSAAREASNEIATWAMLAAGPRIDTLESVRSELRRSKAALPDDPYVDELLGMTLSRNQGDLAGQTEALEHFRSALRTRPVSAYTWANLVRSYYVLGQTGEPFEAALRQASELGPWEPAVQNTVVNYGLAVRDEVAPATRSAIDRTVAAAMRRNPLETLQIADRRGRLDIACRSIVNPSSDPLKRYMACGT